LLFAKPRDRGRIAALIRVFQFFLFATPRDRGRISPPITLIGPGEVKVDLADFDLK
jgi:hypothetical protein